MLAPIAPRYWLKCRFCGGDFTAERKHAEYCSSSCRNKMRRWKLRSAAISTRISTDMAELSRYLAFDEMKPDIVEYFKGISKHVDYLFSAYRIKRI